MALKMKLKPFSCVYNAKVTIICCAKSSACLMLKYVTLSVAYVICVVLLLLLSVVDVQCIVTVCYFFVGKYSDLMM